MEEKTKTFMQAVSEGAAAVASSPDGQDAMRGLNRDQVLAVVKAVTTAIDSLPSTTSLHAVLLGLSFVRNAVILAMKINQEIMASDTGGTPS